MVRSVVGAKWPTRRSEQESNMSGHRALVRYFRTKAAHHDPAGARLRALVLLIAGSAALVLGIAEGAAEPVSTEQILRALTPKPVTRSLSGAPADVAATQSPDQIKFIDSLRNRSTRSLTLDERDQLATVAKDKPSIDIEIDFAYNSAQIGSAAAPGVAALGKALSSPQLTRGTFVLAGHTDAKGSDAYNQDLSERRADAVRRYLIDRYKLPAANLIAVGYGETSLKNKDDPLAAENRRVQIVNLVGNKVAGK
jgi:outer membrane protein OmpA-like peptidoglycan-associated protein